MTFDFTVKEFILGGSTGTPTFQFYRRGFNLGGSATPSWKDVVISGIGSLTLVNAKANGLNYLKLFGGTEQVPETYIDSVTLEGKCEQRNLPDGYTQVEYLEIATDGVYFLTGINATVDTDMGITASNITNNSAQILVAQCISGGDYFRVAKAGATQRIIGNFGASSVTDNNTDGINKFTARVNKSGFYVDGSLIGTFSNIPSSLTGIGEVDIFRGKYSNTSYFAYSGSRFYSAWIDDNIFLPCRRDSDNQLGIYNTKTGQFILPSGTGDFTAGADVTTPTPTNPIDIVCNNGTLGIDNQGNITVTGTVETVTDSNQLTATAQPLLSVGNYKDTQEVLSGAVTRNVGIKVLDGTENWTASSSYAGSCYWTPQGAINIAISYIGLCTHFASASTLSQYTRGKYLQELNAINLWYSDNSTTAVADLKQYLAEQYSAGTPVMVVYALYTPTTETVTPQVLQKSPVTYSGSITGLTGTVVESSHTTPTPTQPLDIVANNGVIKYGHGKNLFDINDLNIGSVPSDAVFYKSFAVPNGTYTMSTPDFPLEVATNVFFLAGNVSSGASTSSNGVAKLKPRTIDVSDGYYTIGYRTGLTNPNNPKDFNWQIELGDTATEYEPYYFGLHYDGTVEKVEVTGKNMFDINNILLYGRAYTVEKSGNNIVATAQDNTATASRFDFFIPVSMFKENTTYYISTKSDVTLTGNQCNVGKAMPQSSTGNAYYASIRTKENGGWSGAFTITDIEEGQEYVSFFYYLGAQDKGTVITISDIMISEGSTATPYEPYFNGGTATAQPLLKVGDYQDVQSVLDGQVTRNVGIKVLDGTEGWASYQSGACWAASSFMKDKVPGNCKSFSTHYGWTSADVNRMQNNQFLLHGTERLCIKDDRFETYIGFIRFLAEQYANGTPVTIIYPLKAPTTETVTGQPLSIQAGTNVVEITQASIDNLELEVSYKAGVEVTVEEIEAVNNDESVEVTING